MLFLLLHSHFVYELLQKLWLVTVLLLYVQLILVRHLVVLYLGTQEDTLAFSALDARLKLAVLWLAKAELLLVFYLIRLNFTNALMLPVNFQ